MIRITKIFYFEMAHAVHGYNGKCKNIHGHSYELHVTIATVEAQQDYLPTPGFVVDFKDLKHWVNSAIVDKLDHSLVLSNNFIAAHPEVTNLDNLLIWEIEPTAENMLIFIKVELNKILPQHLQLIQLKLYETKDSYAEWIA